MSYISVRLVAPLDFQRQSCLFWILLKDTLSASSFSGCYELQNAFGNEAAF